MLVFVLAVALQAHPDAPLTIERLVRLTAGPGVRDNPAAVATATGISVVWEEVRDNHYRLMLGGPDSDGDGQRPRELVAAWDHVWGPSVAERGDTTWLACYVADHTLRTGDRDVMVIRYQGRFGAPIDTVRITRDPPGAAFPLNDASPSLLVTDSRALLAWSEGAFHEHRPTARAYDDKDILGMEIVGRAPLQARTLTGATERGREMSPALARWSAARKDRYLLAYLSQKRDDPYALVVRLFDRTWRRLSSRIIAKSKGGIAHPSVLLLSGVPYVSWVDNTTTDVTIAELDKSLRTKRHWSLRQSLQSTQFASYGPALASLSGARLFDDGGHLGLAFVATMEYQPAAGRVRQEVFLALFR